MRWCLLFVLFSCAKINASADTLQPAVESFNNDLRWKRFHAASQHLPPKEQAAWLERYLDSEDDLFIDSLEVRNVQTFFEEDPPQAVVSVTAQAYLLPSTVLKKVVLIQNWEWDQNKWRLKKSSKELIPVEETP